MTDSPRSQPESPPSETLCKVCGHRKSQHVDEFCFACELADMARHAFVEWKRDGVSLPDDGGARHAD